MKTLVIYILINIEYINISAQFNYVIITHLDEHKCDVCFVFIIKIVDCVTSIRFVSIGLVNDKRMSTGWLSVEFRVKSVR